MRSLREERRSPSARPANDTVRPSLPTIAEPAWFARPVDVRQEGEALTLVFEVAEHPTSALRVEVSGRNLFVWGPRPRRREREEPRHRAMRVFALPFDVAPHDLHTSRTGDLLRVRIAKRADQVSPDPTPRAA